MRKTSVSITPQTVLEKQLFQVNMTPFLPISTICFAKKKKNVKGSLVYFFFQNVNTG